VVSRRHSPESPSTTFARIIGAAAASLVGAVLFPARTSPDAVLAAVNKPKRSHS